MIQLFKRKTPQQLVAEIHNEFDTAEDRLLLQAENVLKELGIDTEQAITAKAEWLKKLGFVNSSPVKWVENNSLVKTREQAEVIRYYKQAYPFQKFLTEAELERICAKYNLVFAPVANYIKDVPEKNLNEIEKVADLRSNDMLLNSIFCNWKFDNSFPITGSKGNWMPMRSKWRMILPTTIQGQHFYSVYTLSEYLNKIYDTGFRYIVGSIDNGTINKQGLFICAPQSHFNTDGLKKAGKFGFLKITVTEVKDPIVFRYCRGGVQVLSKWGLEADDELLVNEKMN